MAYSCLDYTACASDGAEPSEDELERVLNDNYLLHCLVGSDGCCRHKDPPKSNVVHIVEISGYLAQSEYAGSLDVVEIFGGEPGVGTCCDRRRIICGEMLFWFVDLIWRVTNIRITS